MDLRSLNISRFFHTTIAVLIFIAFDHRSTFLNR